MGKTVPGDLEAAIEAYLGGLNSEVAARLHHVSPLRLVRALRERGVMREGAERRQRTYKRMWEARHARMNLPDMDELVRRYEAGESVKSLATAYGFARKSISAWLVAAGVTPRSKSEQAAIEAAKQTPEERRQRALEAQMAARGRTASFEEKARRAQTRQQRGRGISPYELTLQAWLSERGVSSVPQQAIGPYNADLAVADCVAIELHGGGWHGHGRHRARGPERLQYVLGQGWNLAIVWADSRRYPLGPAVADAIAAYVQEVQAAGWRGRYRVFGGDGREFQPGDFSYRAAISLLATENP